MKNTNRYRAFDYSTNIIVSNKNNNSSHYAPYQTIKHQSENKSAKKFLNVYDHVVTHSTPHNSPQVNLNLKIFDRPKGNNKILSRNDRVDLFLEGGRAIETKIITMATMINTMNKNSLNSANHPSNQNFFRQRVMYKTFKNNKSDHRNLIDSEQIIPEIKTNKNKDQGSKSQYQGKNYQNKTRDIEKNQQKPIIIKTLTEEMQKQPVQNSRSNLMNFLSSQQSTNLFHANNKIYKRREIVKKYNNQTRNQIKTCIKIKNNCDSSQKNIFKKNKLKISTEKSQYKKVTLKRPLFYLESKEISHIKADSFIVMQYPTNQIIIGNYYRKIAEIASLTKIMTFYTIWRIAEKYQRNIITEIVEIDEEAQGMTGTSAEIFVGDCYTTEQLLYGLLLPSGNDAAVALAKWGGTIIQVNQINEENTLQKIFSPLKTFVNLMNSEAKILDLKNTKFTNPHGLPNNMSGSNPEELALLVSECLKIELFRKIINTKKYQCQVEHKGVKHEVIWQNTNKLLRRQNFIGVKTGVTITAGPCLATCYSYKSKIFIIILLRTTKLSRRFKETRQILALALMKLDKKQHSNRVKQILRHDADLDSDNSQDEQQFCYDRSDPCQIAKRNKILTYQI